MVSPEVKRRIESLAAEQGRLKSRLEQVENELEAAWASIGASKDGSEATVPTKVRRGPPPKGQMKEWERVLNFVAKDGLPHDTVDIAVNLKKPVHATRAILNFLRRKGKVSKAGDRTWVAARV